MASFPVKKFLIKLCLAATPLLLVVAVYLYSDPFKVLYHYDSFYDNYDPRVNFLNKDYIATETFLHTYEKYHHDSYIFGSSRSGVYLINDWKQHINGAALFHYGSYYENLYGVDRKVAFLHRRGVKIKNALFIVDHELLSETDNPNKPLSRKHPLISGENNLSFQLFMFKSFLQLDYVTTRLKLFLSDKKNDKKGNATSGTLTQPSPGRVEDNEEMRWRNMEKDISENPDSFYTANAAGFYKREPIALCDTPILKQKQIAMLTNIKAILDADTASYKIVISPLYDQKKLNPADLSTLQSIFGQNNVVDFSGDLDITQNMRNYYETSHYRIPVARKIMDSVYGISKH